MSNKKFFIILSVLIAFFIIVNTVVTSQKEDLEYNEVLAVIEKEKSILLEKNNDRYLIGIESHTEITDHKGDPLAFEHIVKGDYVYVDMVEFAFMSDPIQVSAYAIVVKK